MKTFFGNSIQDAEGNLVPSGSYVQLILSEDTTTGVEPISLVPIIIPISAGSFSQSIWFNDELQPSTLYNVQIVTPNYGAIYNQNIPITGASFNLASWTPTG
jgi:hypothetical protein